MAKEKVKFNINISITVETPEGRKTYSWSQIYEGDPTKVSLDVMLDAWFIENKIDKSQLTDVNAYLFKDMRDTLPVCGW